jgi:hypothetical protein
LSKKGSRKKTSGLSGAQDQGRCWQRSAKAAASNGNLLALRQSRLRVDHRKAMT